MSVKTYLFCSRGTDTWVLHKLSNLHRYALLHATLPTPSLFHWPLQMKMTSLKDQQWSSQCVCAWRWRHIHHQDTVNRTHERSSSTKQCVVHVFSTLVNISQPGYFEKEYSLSVPGFCNTWSQVLIFVLQTPVPVFTIEPELTVTCRRITGWQDFIPANKETLFYRSR